MKFKDLVSIAHNKKNNQVNLSVRRGKLKKLDMDIEDLLEIKLHYSKE